jgi:hypothetical protein
LKDQRGWKQGEAAKEEIAERQNATQKDQDIF